MEKVADAVFEGGGVKGIGLVGAICCLEDNGYKWKNIAGTSAGSIIASLLAVGYTGKELKDIILDLNYKIFLEKTKTAKIPVIGDIVSFLKQNGIYTGNTIEQWIRELLQKKGKTKFKDITTNGVCKLKIIATDITRKDMLVLPDDLIKYNIDPMEFEIAKAVRMSISIPFYFVPQELNYQDRSSFIVDGGVLSNFPVWIFDVEEAPRWPTIGFELVNDEHEYESTKGEGIIDFAMNILDTMLEKNEMRYIKNKDYVRTVMIPSLKVKTTEFGISKEKCKMLFESGYSAAENFLNKWDFEQYKKEYRI